MSIQTSLAAKRRVFSGTIVRHEMCLVLILLAVAGTIFAYSRQTGVSMPLLAVPEGMTAASYGQLPLSFVPNAGQSDAAVRYQTHAMGGVLSFEEDAVVLSLPAAGSGQPTDDPAHALVVLRFDGTDSAQRVVPAEPLPGRVNYLIGNQPSRWLTDLPTYGSIVYEQLYPGIDLRYDGAQSSLKGTYTLAPQADPARIRWRYQGVTGARTDAETGDLLLAVAGASTLIEKAPSAWQTVAGARVNVPVSYALMADGGIGFALGDYDRSETLTIDPKLIYSTFLGGSAFDGAKSVAVDFAGNAYITGETRSTNFPTHNAISNTLNGGSDAFVVKINATGTALVYATYLGGSNYEDEFGNERAGGIAVDSSGFAYVTGCTNSADFPVVNPIQATHGVSTNCDVFVAKLDPAGSALIYSTFLGGSGADSASAIAVDDQGSAYIAGDAGLGFPGNPFTSSTHAFVLKINSAGSAVVFSKFLGGTGHEYAVDIAVDSTHNMYVVGNTYSTDFPVVNAAQPTKGGGASTKNDAFVTKIAADGSALVYSTYLGGSNPDEASGIALDDLGNAYVTGVTQSLDFPTVNAYQPAYGGERGDVFVTKLNPAGNAFVYSTYLGGNNDENYFSGHGPYGAIAVDSAYRAYVTGYTCSTNFPMIGSFRKARSGSCYAFVTQFNAAGSALIFSTLIGTQSGGNDTYGADIALDPLANVYLVGETNATDFLISNSIQLASGGMYDAFVTKFDPHFFVNLPQIAKPAGPTATVKVTSPNGSEQWQPGTTHTITWTQSGLSGNVTLQLYKGASLSSQVGTPVASAGSFAWTLPANLTVGNDYRIRIFQGAVEDYSDANFFIVALRKHDLLGSWSTGVSSLNSDTGAWNLITSSAADQVAAGDMDGDGKADIVATFPSSGLWVKYSTTGQWQFISSPPAGIALGDFNGDGKADLAGIWGGVTWLRDSASGSWTAGPSGATLIAAGDMNGDGKADLVGSWPTTGVWVQYSATGAWANLSMDPATMIALGDFNGDGKADLAGIWSNIIWLRDTASGVWTAGPADATRIAAGDLNGDGKADLLVNYPTTGVWVQYSATGAWSNLTPAPATWIATGVLR